MEPQKWVDLYGDQLYGYAYVRVQDRMVAEDLVQETFLAALAASDGFEGRSSEKTWLTAILKHKIIDHFRKLGRQPMNQSQGHEKQSNHFFHENGNWKDKPGRWDTTHPRTDSPSERIPGRIYALPLRALGAAEDSLQPP